MAERGVMIEFYDCPETDEFNDWLYGPHYDEVFSIIPGVRPIKRYEIMNPATPGLQRIVILLESDDIQAAWNFRTTPRGLRSRLESDVHGLANREEYYCRLLYEGHKRDDGTVEGRRIQYDT
ncbi:MAG: hypothetical protein HYU88_06970 [Chloroflexi bacterium]|nr:hypothetical protein [Chloroflexota bacterium]